MNVSKAQPEEECKKRSPYYLKTFLPKFKSCYDLFDEIENKTLINNLQAQEENENKAIGINGKRNCMPRSRRIIY